jgi:hypothetical protein
MLHCVVLSSLGLYVFLMGSSCLLLFSNLSLGFHRLHLQLKASPTLTGVSNMLKIFLTHRFQIQNIKNGTYSPCPVFHNFAFFHMLFSPVAYIRMVPWWCHQSEKVGIVGYCLLILTNQTNHQVCVSISGFIGFILRDLWNDSEVKSRSLSRVWSCKK